MGLVPAFMARTSRTLPAKTEAEPDEDMEGRINACETATGLDLDNDGDVGVVTAKPGDSDLQRENEAAAVVRVQAKVRGWSTRLAGGTVNPEKLQRLVIQLRAEQRGFRNLLNRLLVLFAFIAVILLHRDVGGASATERALQRAIDMANDRFAGRYGHVVRTVDDAFNWVRIAYDGESGSKPMLAAASDESNRVCSNLPDRLVRLRRWAQPRGRECVQAANVRHLARVVPPGTRRLRATPKFRPLVPCRLGAGIR